MGDTKRDIVWVLRAAHHMPGTILRGNEVLPRDDVALDPQVQRWIKRVETQSKGQGWRPQPRTGAKYFPLTHVVEADESESDTCESVLELLSHVRFSRGGQIEVFRVPPRGSKEYAALQSYVQDSLPQDAWAWRTLMPLYFQRIAVREPQWMVQCFDTQWVWTGSDMAPCVVGLSPGKQFARYASVALLAPSEAPHCVRLLTLDGHDARYSSTHFWELPGGHVDRSRDVSWEAAARREFEEELNPASWPEWSESVAVTSPVVVLSLKNYLPPSGPRDKRQASINLSRPCLNFVVAWSRPEFVAMLASTDDIQKVGRNSYSQRITPPVRATRRRNAGCTPRTLLSRAL